MSFAQILESLYEVSDNSNEIVMTSTSTAMELVCFNDSALNAFNFKYSEATDFTELGPEKIKFMKALLKQLNLYTQSKNLLKDYHEKIVTILDSLRICSRERDDSKEMWTEDSVKTILSVCIMGSDNEITPNDSYRVNIMGFRCLINILFNNMSARKLFSSSEKNIHSLIQYLRSKLNYEAAFQCIKLLYLLAANEISSFSSDMLTLLFEVSVMTLTTHINSSSNVTSQTISSLKALITMACKLIACLSVDKISAHSIIREGKDILLWSQTIFKHTVSAILAIQVSDDDILPYHDFALSFDITKVMTLAPACSPINQGSVNSSTAQVNRFNDRDILEMKRYVLQAAMDAGPHLGDILFKQNALVEICYLLAIQLTTVEKYPMMKENEKTSLLTPTIVVLTNAISESDDAMRIVKLIIFPNEVIPNNLKNSDFNEANMKDVMHARDVPKGSLRAMLINHMTSMAHLIKRSVSEFLFLLCNENREEFVMRVGYGNGIAQLNLKGQLPCAIDGL